MPDNSVDPSGNTEAFRAFTETPAEPPANSRALLIVVGAVAAVVLLVSIVLLVG